MNISPPSPHSAATGEIQFKALHDHLQQMPNKAGNGFFEPFKSKIFCRSPFKHWILTTPLHAIQLVTRSNNCKYCSLQLKKTRVLHRHSLLLLLTEVPKQYPTEVPKYYPNRCE